MRLSVAHRHRIVALALDLTAWLQTLALHNHPGRRWEPKQHAYSYSRFPRGSPVTPAAPICDCPDITAAPACF